MNLHLLVSVVGKAVFLRHSSDTGTTPYESCLFSFFLNLSALLGKCHQFSFTSTITNHTMIRWCSAIDQFPIIYERNKYFVVY